MKKFLLRIICMAFALSMAVACSATSTHVTERSLKHHNFQLVSVDGQPYNLRQPAPNIAFNENMQVSGRMCNRFHGQGKLSSGMLTVSQLATTRMLCNEPELNQYEALLGQMLAAGVALDYQGQVLIMRQGGHELVYSLRDFVN